MTGRLEGKVAIITGAGSVGSGWGNGRAAAILFAREGARVVAVDRVPESLAETVAAIENDGGQVDAVTCDVTDSASVSALVREVVDRHGGLDVLVNNVGGSRAGGPTELSEEDWHAQLELNLTSAYLTCKHAIPAMRDRGGGAIVNTASTSGLRFTGSPQVGYAAAKAGVIQLTRVVAVQHAPDRIRANTVVPGQLHTPLVENRLVRQRGAANLDELLETRQRRIPLGFMGDGRDTGYAAVFLASDEARFITGTEIVIDGGMTARCD